MNNFLIKTISYKGNKISYKLIIKNQKYIRLKIEDSSIIVSAPPHSQDWEINNLIYKNMGKISQIIERSQKYQVLDFKDKMFVKINNENKQLHILEDKNYNKVINHKEKIFIKIYENDEDTVKHFYKYLSLKYYDYFLDRIKEIGDSLNLFFKNFSLKFIKGKWGVCYPEQSKIILNVRLIHFPIQAKEYVMIHELTHLLHKNHSKDFWHTIQKILPDYKKMAELLK